MRPIVLAIGCVMLVIGLALVYRSRKIETQASADAEACTDAANQYGTAGVATVSAIRSASEAADRANSLFGSGFVLSVVGVIIAVISFG